MWVCVQVVDAIIEGCSYDGRYKHKVKSAYTLVKVYAGMHSALADATIQCWREKYRHNFWRCATSCATRCFASCSASYARLHASNQSTFALPEMQRAQSDNSTSKKVSQRQRSQATSNKVSQ
jgi:hypothetical protein